MSRCRPIAACRTRDGFRFAQPILRKARADPRHRCTPNGPTLDLKAQSPDPSRSNLEPQGPRASTSTGPSVDLQAPGSDLQGLTRRPRKPEASTPKVQASTSTRGASTPEAPTVDLQRSNPGPQEVQPPQTTTHKKPGGQGSRLIRRAVPWRRFNATPGGGALPQAGSASTARRLRAKRVDRSRRALFSASPLPDTSSRR